ncbi:MAG: response regulator [Candidatus Omnitrophota bacterium]|jgi:DNA-binding NtrC family response regulator
MNKALVVDDEEDICDLLGEELERFGLEVSTANIGETAVQLIEQSQWLLCVFDMKLPTTISGLDLIRLVKAKSPKTIVAAMTGYVDVALQQEIEKAGADVYLSKPDDLRRDVFHEKIKALLEGRPGPQA